MANQKHSCTKDGTDDIWEVQTNQKGVFQKATLNGEKMVEKWVAEGPDRSKPVDFNKMQDDFNAHPHSPRSSVPTNPTYQYSIPVKGPSGIVLLYNCGGQGKVPCGGQ